MKRYTPEELAVVLSDHLKWVRSEEGGKRANLQGADLQGADLQGANFQGAYLQGAYLQGANFQGANFQGACLQGADLQGANFQGANIQDAYLQGAYLQDANIQGANIQDACLQGAYLQGANFQGAYLQDLKIRSLAVFSGLYAYVAMPIVADDGTEWVKLGCHTRKVMDWEANFWNNNNEFPNDGSAKSQMRLMAYNTCLEWLRIHRVPTEALPIDTPNQGEKE